MNVSLDTSATSDLSAPLVAVAFFQDDDAPGAELTALDQRAGGRLVTIAREEGFTGEPGKTLLVHLPDASFKRVLLVGAGKASEARALDLRKLAAAAAEEADKRHLALATVALPAALTSANPALAVRYATEGVLLGAYRYTAWLTDEKETRRYLEGVRLSLPGADQAALAPAIARAQVTAAAVNLARDLVNAPPVEVTPRRLAEVAEHIAREQHLECTIFDEARIAAEKMNLLAAVGGGSSQPPRFIHLTYRPDGADASTPQVALVGKGLTYDAGGYNIKPTGSLEDMKIDMAGAAAVLGAMKAIRAVAPRVIVHGIVPSAENLVSSTAYKPGDVIRSHNGKTVEIMNTDAEGRLVLADVLAYARTLEPDLLLDNATLTGACVVALGPTVSGFYSNRPELAEAVKRASKDAGEAMWHMPLVEELRDGLKSDWADIKHTADRWGGSITAALFLREFVGDTPWVHVDIAGPSMASKAYGIYPKGGTGHGVLTYLKLIEQLAG